MHQTKKRIEKSNSKANLAKIEMIIIVISSEVSVVTNMKDWVVPGTSMKTKVHLLPIPL
ncbi:hypothetical protein AAG906_029437 [Vitis piasezkii]